MTNFGDDNISPVPVYQGGWGSKWQLTRNPFENNNEQTVAVDSAGNVTIVNRRYKTVEDGDGTKESDVSDLIVRRFEPMSTLSIEDADIQIYPEYPMPGENAVLTIKAVNAGFKPSKQVTFQLDLVDDTSDEEGNYPDDDEDYNLDEEDDYPDEDETAVPLCDYIVIDSHISSGAEITATTEFVVPENFADKLIRIKALEEDMENTATVKYYKIPLNHNLVIENQRGYFFSNDTIRLTATVLNLGNTTAENVKLTIENQMRMPL
ncbi:MAG TPA: hypothetical protein GXX20_07640 [Clostridiaceae bacterium]|nr:hypothetical protein [Clostridiaceae bacterium]